MDETTHPRSMCTQQSNTNCHRTCHIIQNTSLQIEFYRHHENHIDEKSTNSCLETVGCMPSPSDSNTYSSCRRWWNRGGNFHVRRNDIVYRLSRSRGLRLVRIHLQPLHRDDCGYSQIHSGSQYDCGTSLRGSRSGKCRSESMRQPSRLPILYFYGPFGWSEHLLVLSRIRRLLRRALQYGGVRTKHLQGSCPSSRGNIHHRLLL